MLSVIPLPPNLFAPLRLNIRDTDLAVHPTVLVGRERENGRCIVAPATS